MARVSQSAQHLSDSTFSRRNQNRQGSSALVMMCQRFVLADHYHNSIPILLLYRHEMSAFFFESHSSPPNIPKEPRVRNLTPVVRVCVYSPRRLDTSLCRARRRPPLSSAGSRTRDDEDRRRQSAHQQNLREAIPSYDAEERDYLIRTIAFEASGEPEEGKAAVAHVIPQSKVERQMG